MDMVDALREDAADDFLYGEPTLSCSCFVVYDEVMTCLLNVEPNRRYLKELLRLACQFDPVCT